MGSRRKDRRRNEGASDEDDRIEELFLKRQKNKVANWGAGDSPSHKESHATPSPNADIEEQDFDSSFQFDTQGDISALPEHRISENDVQPDASAREDGLLLPSHVQIDSSGEQGAEFSAEQGSESGGSGDEDNDLGDYIALDGGRSGPSARYYEAEEYNQRRAFEKCPTCGEMGHDKKTCPHLQCLACGALDDHATRDCRQGVSCFRCGKLGHKSAECSLSRRQGISKRSGRDCSRCGSLAHADSTCPLLWRVYRFNDRDTYVNFIKARWNELGLDADADKLTQGFDYRSESSDEEDGQLNGRGKSPPKDWVPTTRWCYNCASQGQHWGDDCPVPRCNPIRPSGDASAYSEHNAMYGPFAHLRSQQKPVSHYDNDAMADYVNNFQAGPEASIHVFDPPVRRAGPRSNRNTDRKGRPAKSQSKEPRSKTRDSSDSRMKEHAERTSASEAAKGNQKRSRFDNVTSFASRKKQRQLDDHERKSEDRSREKSASEQGPTSHRVSRSNQEKKHASVPLKDRIQSPKKGDTSTHLIAQKGDVSARLNTQKRETFGTKKKSSNHSQKKDVATGNSARSRSAARKTARKTTKKHS